MKGSLNTPVFQNKNSASKLSTIEKCAMNLNRDLSENVKLEVSGASSSKKSIKNSSIEKKPLVKDYGKTSKKSNRLSKEIEIK